MKATLIIMAAGLASRYGGNKQVEGIGPNGEILMEYSIYDAVRAGFGKVVFIIKPDMQELMERLVGYLRNVKTLSGEPLEVVYAFQDFSSVPSFYKIPEERVKPFGTVHAVLCAREYVHEPFCVINADDYYGIAAFQTIYHELKRLPENGKGTMVGYLLKNTASLHGAVSRGVCRVRNGRLVDIKETKRIQLYANGTLRDLDANVELAPNMPVSMNFWGFMPSIFDTLEIYFDDFLRKLPEGETKAECLLPIMVGDKLKEDTLKVSVLESTDHWFGMTYREDRAIVAEELKALHDKQLYPASLRP